MFTNEELRVLLEQHGYHILIEQRVLKFGTTGNYTKKKKRGNKMTFEDFEMANKLKPQIDLMKRVLGSGVGNTEVRYSTPNEDTPIHLSEASRCHIQDIIREELKLLEEKFTSL